MAASIQTELDQLKTALANAKATIANQATEITTLQAQVLDPTQAAELTAIAQDAAASFPTPASPSPAPAAS